MSKIIAIKERHLFSRAYTKGKKMAGKLFVCYLLPNYKTKETLFGITVSKKLGKAVKRSRVRRIARAGFSQLLDNHTLSKNYIIVVVARSAVFEKNVKSTDVYSDLTDSFSKLDAFMPEIES